MCIEAVALLIGVPLLMWFFETGGFFMRLKIKRVGEHQLPLPEYKSAGAAGFDLMAAIKDTLCLAPGDSLRVPTGFAFEIPEGFEGQVRGRSGLAFNFGITSYLGTIDSDYRGEVKVLLFNQGDDDFFIHPGARISQMVIAAVSHCDLEETELSQTERGTKGFGSTGIAPCTAKEECSACVAAEVKP